MRKSTWGLPALTIAVSGYVAPAFAAGLPQLDASKFAPQLVWLVITFAVLYVLMSRVALPKIGSVLAARKDRIEGNLERAQTLKADAQALADAYEQAIAEARQNAQGVVAEARNTMSADASSRHDELNERLSAKVTAAEQRIAKATQEAVAGVRDLALDVAATAAERLTGDAPDGKAVSAAVDAVLKERD
ncbi:MAG: F0F1 ATP synthase subunit B' [Rhodospirillales bacterium]|nr:F0F1 ATP synthase subunit B' [Rhodospirillales bacterium]